jgi:LTXXQ motif family protein
MKKWIFAGAIALATAGPVFVGGNPASAGVFESKKITDVNIAAIKAELRLTVEQLPLWQRVEEALRAIAREQAQEESAGLLRRVSRRMVAVVFDDATVQRLKEVAMPLLASLSEEQKVAARRVAHKLGMGEMVAIAH